MAHITLSIPDETYKEMKRRAEIKWSEVARASIIAYLRKQRNITNSEEILGRLSNNTKKIIRSMKEKEAIKFAKEVSKEEWKRIKSLTRIS